MKTWIFHEKYVVFNSTYIFIHICVIANRYHSPRPGVVALCVSRCLSVGAPLWMTRDEEETYTFYILLRIVMAINSLSPFVKNKARMGMKMTKIPKINQILFFFVCRRWRWWNGTGHKLKRTIIGFSDRFIERKWFLLCYLAIFAFFASFFEREFSLFLIRFSISFFIRHAKYIGEILKCVWCKRAGPRARALFMCYSWFQIIIPPHEFNQSQD